MEIDLHARQHVAGDLSADDDVLRDQVGLDRGAAAYRQVVIAELDRPFHAAVDGQVLGAGDLALDQQRLPDPRGHAAFRRSVSIRHAFLTPPWGSWKYSGRERLDQPPLSFSLIRAFTSFRTNAAGSGASG